MNNIENDLNSQFKKMKEGVKLSVQEKDFHRGEILKFINEKPSPYVEKVIRSPFYFAFFFRKHLVITSLAMILVFSTSLGVSSANSLPNNSLYSIKTKILEPISIFLTTTPKAKAKLKVALVEKRMQEFFQVTISKNLSLEDKTAFISQLSSQVKDAHKGISQLVEEKDLSGATEVTNDLQSILSAQDTVLDTLDVTNPDENGTSEIASVISDSIQTTTEIENNITETVQTSENETALDATVNNQKEEISKTLENLEKEKQENVSEDINNVEVISQIDIDLKISKIKLSLEEANKKAEKGDKKGALELYNQIDQDLGEIESLIDTEQKLHVEDVGENEEPKDLSEDNNTLPVDLENPPAQEQINIRIN